MKKKSISKKILIALIFITTVNIFTLALWFLCNVEPMVNKKRYLKKEIVTKEIKDNYQSFDDLIIALDKIKKEKEITFSIEKEKINKDKQDLYLFSKKVFIDNEPYIVSAYFYKNMSILRLILELLVLQSILLTICMLLVFLFARDKIIKPVNKIIEAIRNYKFGKKPEAVPTENEFALIQNEFVALVDSLEEEKKEQNRIIASISHDIKTPLTSIIGYSDLIEEDNLTKEEIKKYNQKIYGKALHLKNVLATFDDYLINQKGQKLKLTAIKIKDLVEEIEKDYKLELMNNGVELVIKTNIEKEIIKLDIVKFKRIISNLISNSMRYLNENGCILIEITSDKDNFFFHFKDNGQGVDEKIIDKIFEPLFTTDNSRKISGLGLSICKEFVLMHEGSITGYNDNGFNIDFSISKNL
ncbi:sensor histidine kinase [bacterium]|nr:sensor histidine kinase [bacterium]